MRALILGLLLCAPAGASEYKDLLEQVHAAEKAEDLALETELLKRAIKAWMPADGRANLRVSLSNLGLDLFDQHRYQDAVDCYDQALKIDPGHAVTRANRAAALESLHRWFQAMPDIEVAYRNGDGHTRLAALEAWCVSLMTMDQWDKALKYCSDMAKYDHSVLPLQQLASVYAHLGRQAEAEKTLQDSIEAPNQDRYNERDRWLYDVNARVAQAVVWEFGGQGGKADEDLSRLVEAFPDKAYPLYRRGRLRLDLGYVNPAIDDFTRVTALEPDFAEAYAWRAAAQEKAGRTDAAAADRTQACALDWAYACPAKPRRK